MLRHPDYDLWVQRYGKTHADDENRTWLDKLRSRGELISVCCEPGCWSGIDCGHPDHQRREEFVFPGDWQ